MVYYRWYNIVRGAAYGRPAIREALRVGIVLERVLRDGVMDDVMGGGAELLEIVQDALGTFDYRQSYAPGMFEPLKPLFRRLGYRAVAVYITDDYPDRMHRSCSFGAGVDFPPYVVLNRAGSLADEFNALARRLPGLVTEPLFSHGRQLGMLAVTHDRPDDRRVREALTILARTMSVMAYVEIIRTNSRREREERDIFFAQSLTNRLLLREPPKMRELRLGFEFIRSLEAGGDFFDLVPDADGGLFGFIGCCNGQGLRTVLEVSGIMRSIHRAKYSCDSLSAVLGMVNDMLVREQRRAHQASLALFQVDVKRRKLTLAKAGRLGLLLCGPGTGINSVSAPGSTFLGMVESPGVVDEEYDFGPGQSLFAVTEGFYSSRNIMKVRPQIHWFMESVSAILATKHKKPLANAIFDSVNRNNDHTARPVNSMLALSVEFRGRSRDSVCLK